MAKKRESILERWKKKSYIVNLSRGELTSNRDSVRWKFIDKEVIKYFFSLQISFGFLSNEIFLDAANAFPPSFHIYTCIHQRVELHLTLKNPIKRPEKRNRSHSLAEGSKRILLCFVVGPYFVKIVTYHWVEKIHRFKRRLRNHYRYKLLKGISVHQYLIQFNLILVDWDRRYWKWFSIGCAYSLYPWIIKYERSFCCFEIMV